MTLLVNLLIFAGLAVAPVVVLSLLRRVVRRLGRQHPPRDF
jgi:hypothetical protein